LVSERRGGDYHFTGRRHREGDTKRIAQIWGGKMGKINHPPGGEIFSKKGRGRALGGSFKGRREEEKFEKKALNVT